MLLTKACAALSLLRKLKVLPLSKEGILRQSEYYSEAMSDNESLLTTEKYANWSFLYRASCIKTW